MRNRTFFLFILIVCLSFILFYPLIFTYFFQDDFFIFSITHVSKISHFLNFFIPRSDVQFYRPIGTEVFFWLFRMIFGWNPISFHLILWIFFISILYLVFRLSSKFIGTNRGGLVVCFFYAISAIHYNTLSWLSNSSYIIGTFLFLLFFCYIFAKFSSKTIATLLYILGLLTFEFAILIPLILGIGECLKVFKLKKSKVSYVSLGIVTIFYLILRFVLFKPDASSYHFVFNHMIISSYRYFILYLLNWPETMKDNFIKYWMIRPIFAKTFFSDVMVWGLGSIIAFFVFCIGVIVSRFRYNRIYLFLLFFFIVSLLPIVAVPSHIAPHHGIIAMLPFLLLIYFPIFKAKIYKQKSLKLLLVITCCVSILASFRTIQFNQEHHWIKRRSDIAKYWINYAQKNKDEIMTEKSISIGNIDKETQVALFDEKAFQEYFLSPDIKLKYNLNYQ